MPIRVGITDFFILNKPKFARLNYEQTFQLERYAHTSEPRQVVIDFDPEMLVVDFLAAETSKTQAFTFTEVGEKHCTVQMTYNNITEVTVYTVTVFKGCVSTPDLFQVEHRNPSTPMMVLISKVPTVSGRGVRTDECLGTQHHVYKWQLWRDIGSPPEHSWEAVSIPQPEANSLVLSKYILEPGLYRVWLEVSVTGSEEYVADTLHISASLPSIVADISGGGSLQEAVIGQAHVLDAEASSYDPARAELDQSTLGPSSLSYSWTCYKLDTEDLVARYTAPFSVDTSYRLLPECTETGALPEQGEFTLDTTSFHLGELALFEVFVRSNIGGRHASAVTVFKMVSGERPQVSLK